MALRAIKDDETQLWGGRLKGGCSQDWLPHKTT
jgi:hypothetical protein